MALECELTALQPIAALRTPDVKRVRREFSALAADWRQALVDGSEHARPIVVRLRGRVTFTPLGKPEYVMKGAGSYAGLFQRVFPPVVRPQRDSDACGQSSGRALSRHGRVSRRPEALRGYVTLTGENSACASVPFGC